MGIREFGTANPEEFAQKALAFLEDSKQWHGVRR